MVYLARNVLCCMSRSVDGGALMVAPWSEMALRKGFEVSGRCYSQ